MQLQNEIPLGQCLNLIHVSVLASPGRKTEHYLPLSSISDRYLQFLLVLSHLVFNIQCPVIGFPLLPTKISNGNLFKKNCGGILGSESHKKGKNIKYRQLLVSMALVLRLGFQFIYIRGKEEMMDGYGQVCKGRGKGTQLRQFMPYNFKFLHEIEARVVQLSKKSTWFNEKWG